MDDREILALLESRNEEALTVLEKRYGRKLHRLARNILSNESDVQECVNDTYLAVWNAVPPNHPKPLAPFIYRLCKNIAIDRLRAITAQKRSGYEIALDELSEAIGYDSLEQQMEAKELGAAIEQYLSTLSKVNRVLFLRRYWHGDSVGQLARQFFMTEGAVSTRLSRMRSGLRDHLTKEGHL